MGDRVEADEAVITIETDKVTHEAKSPVAGAITAIMVEEGDIMVRMGSPILEDLCDVTVEALEQRIKRDDSIVVELCPGGEEDVRRGQRGVGEPHHEHLRRWDRSVRL